MWGTGRKFFDCIDLHCGGEPARVMFSTNCPPIPGKSMAEKRECMIQHFDYIRRVLLQVWVQRNNRHNFFSNYEIDQFASSMRRISSSSSAITPCGL